MAIFFVLFSVVVVAALVIGYLFYTLHKESLMAKEKVVPVVELKESKPLAPSMEIPMNESYGPSELERKESQLREITKEYALKEAAYQSRVVELEAELQNIAQKAQEQSHQALTSLDDLKRENEQLKSERGSFDVNAQYNLGKAQETITNLHAEQSMLENRLIASQDQIRHLQDEVVSIKQQMAKEVIQAKTDTEKLNAENLQLRQSLENSTSELTKNFQTEIAQLQQENQTLKNASHDLTMTNQKLKELNDNLIEKSESLQWELTKTRAQMTSFERACENYQHQLKDVSERTGSVQQDFSKLNENHNRLREILEGIQKQNDELVKREKLYESELDKKRNQIVALEREYETLRAKGIS